MFIGMRDTRSCCLVAVKSVPWRNSQHLALSAIGKPGLAAFDAIPRHSMVDSAKSWGFCDRLDRQGVSMVDSAKWWDFACVRSEKLPASARHHITSICGSDLLS